MKLAPDDTTQICQRVVDYDADSGLAAEQFEISRLRVQQLAKVYRESSEIPQSETPAEAFGQLIPSPARGVGDFLTTEVIVDG